MQLGQLVTDLFPLFDEPAPVASDQLRGIIVPSAQPTLELLNSQSPVISFGGLFSYPLKERASPKPCFVRRPLFGCGLTVARPSSASLS